MLEENYKVLASKRINLIIEMNRLILLYGGKARKLIQHNIVDTLIKRGHTLFNLTFKCLKGENNSNKITKLLMDILADIYYIKCLEGFTPKQAIVLDNMCDTLLNYDADLESSINQD